MCAVVVAVVVLPMSCPEMGNVWEVFRATDGDGSPQERYMRERVFFLPDFVVLASCQRVPPMGVRVTTQPTVGRLVRPALLPAGERGSSPGVCSVFPPAVLVGSAFHTACTNQPTPRTGTAAIQCTEIAAVTTAFLHCCVLSSDERLLFVLATRAVKVELDHARLAMLAVLLSGALGAGAGVPSSPSLIDAHAGFAAVSADAETCFSFAVTF